MKKVILTILVLIGIIKIASASDSLKVHIIGYYFKKGEKFALSDGKYVWGIFPVKGLNGFAFYISLPDSIQSGDRLPLGISRKGRFGWKYKSIALEPVYEADRKYFVLIRDFRLKNKYAFNYCWSNDPFLGILLKQDLWLDNYIPKWAEIKEVHKVQHIVPVKK